MTWSETVNGYLYQFVGFILQAARAHNITIEGCDKYNVPSGNITVDQAGNPSSGDLTSYSGTAIFGADNYIDPNATITDLFDIAVDVTRRITPTCASRGDSFACSFC